MGCFSHRGNTGLKSGRLEGGKKSENIFTHCVKSLFGHNLDEAPADAWPGSLGGGAQLPECAEQLVDLRVAREEWLPIHLPSVEWTYTPGLLKKITISTKIQPKLQVSTAPV